MILPVNGQLVFIKRRSHNQQVIITNLPAGSVAKEAVL
jgi:hypothetical protein